MARRNSTGSFPVSITSPATFEITLEPGNVAFSYTAFDPAVNASATFVTTGALALPCTMTRDAYSGVVTGLNYSLKLIPKHLQSASYCTPNWDQEVHPRSFRRNHLSIAVQWQRTPPN